MRETSRPTRNRYTPHPDTLAITALRQRPAQAWFALLTEVQDPFVRSAAASIIWWDFFGGLSASKHIGLFDKWIYAYDHERDVPIEELAGVLMWGGYPPTFARRRATPPKLYDNSRRKRKPAEAAA